MAVDDWMQDCATSNYEVRRDMSTVMIRQSTYDDETLRSHLHGMLDALGGKAIHRGSRVVIKPNLLMPAAPETAIVTHPAIVRIVAEYALARGAEVQVSDSQAMGSFPRILKVSGLGAALEGLGCDIRPFSTSATVDIGEPFGAVEIAEEAMTADVLINLAKLKTHSQMLLTLGVKNCFGCIVGYRKPEWHMRAGIDREIFARLLVQICRAVKPAITIVDGILAMHGTGPGRRGKPIPLGLLAGGTDPLPVDAAICRALAMEPDSLLTNRIAREMGLFTEDSAEVETMASITNFTLPPFAPLVYGPAFLHGTIRKYLIQRPVAETDRCTLCGQCRDYCPAGAITLGAKQPHFDYNRCIRCYCCIEVCPQGALRTHEGLAGRLIRRYIHRTR